MGEIKDKVSLLKKHLSDLTEATAKIKIERQSNTVKVPRITRNVGLQVNLSNSYSSKKTSAKKGSEMKTSRIDSDLKTTPYVLKPGAEMVELSDEDVESRPAASKKKIPVTEISEKG